MAGISYLCSMKTLQKTTKLGVTALFDSDPALTQAEKTNQSGPSPTGVLDDRGLHCGT